MTDREKLNAIVEDWSYKDKEKSVSYSLTDHLLANGVVVREWIPVSEPPKEKGIYQVFGYDKEWERTKVWYGQFTGCDWFVYDIYGDGKRFDVTHWMPLPEPPMRKGENG